ncbi:polysaccharide biosynthesis protein [Candidatus Magnetomorum sp. HK-1]|nr:polysaccharide biosynthesis protein [Candidatus Magnetomorum sp. HK-1]
MNIKARLQSKDSKRLLSNFCSLSVLQVVNYILPIITLPYLIRVLGAEYFGLLAFANATIIYLGIITDYGFNLTATREISIHREDNKKIIEIFNAVMSIKILLMSACFILLCILIFSLDKFSKNWEIYFFTFGTVIGQVFFPVWFFQGMEQMKYITYLNILARSIFTIAIFILVQEQEDFYIVPILSSLGFIVAGMWSLLIINRKFKIRFAWQNTETIRMYLKDSWNVFVIDFMPNLYNNFSTFFLGFFVSMEMLGYYSLATKIVDIFNQFIYVIRNVTYPYLSNNFSKFAIISQATLLVGLSFSVAIICLANSLFYLVFGEIILKSLLFIYILALSPFLLAVTVSFGSNKLLVLKKDREMKNITVLYSIFGFVLALSLVPVYGAIGAAITLITTRGLMACLTYIKSMQLDL